MSAIEAFGQTLAVLGAVMVVGWLLLAGPLWLLDAWRKRQVNR